MQPAVTDQDQHGKHNRQRHPKATLPSFRGEHVCTSPCSAKPISAEKASTPMHPHVSLAAGVSAHVRAGVKGTLLCAIARIRGRTLALVTGFNMAIMCFMTKAPARGPPPFPSPCSGAPPSPFPRRTIIRAQHRTSCTVTLESSFTARAKIVLNIFPVRLSCWTPRAVNNSHVFRRSLSASGLARVSSCGTAEALRSLS